MPPVESLDALLYTVAAALLFWLGKIGGKWWDERTSDRRRRTDRLAKAERQVRLLTESLHEHRSVMIRSGCWTRDTLPPFVERDWE